MRHDSFLHFRSPRVSNLYARLKNALAAVVHFVGRTVLNELPLFATTLLLWGSECLRDEEGLLRYDGTTPLSHYASRLCIVAFQAFVIACCLRLVPRRNIVRLATYVLIVVPVVLAWFLRGQAGMEICGTALQMAYETDMNEAAAFLRVYVMDFGVIAVGALLIAAVAVWVWAERRWQEFVPRVGTFGCRRPLGWLLIAMLLIGGGLFVRYSVLLVRAKMSGDSAHWNACTTAIAPRDPLTKFAFAVLDLRSMRRAVVRAVGQTAEYVAKEPARSDTDSLHVVLVVGESYIRSHSALYGYRLPTTPRQEAEHRGGSLAVFTDAVSPAATTIVAMQRLFFVTDSDEKAWYDGVFLPAVFRSAGYHVAFLDNQQTMRTGLREEGVGDKAFPVLNPMFAPAMARLSYDYFGSTSHDYDGGLIDELFTLADTASRCLTILHLKGQHFDAAWTFPNDTAHELFTSSDYDWRHEAWLTEEKRQHIADYDNATCYNDLQLGRLYDHYRHKRAVIVYLSDHGEEVYDYRDRWGRTHRYEDVAQTELYFRVPLTIWLSDAYRAAFPETARRVAAASSRPCMTTALPHLLFDLAAVRTPLYSATANPLSPRYAPGPRTLYDGRDFDKAVMTP